MRRAAKYAASRASHQSYELFRLFRCVFRNPGAFGSRCTEASSFCPDVPSLRTRWVVRGQRRKSNAVKHPMKLQMPRQLLALRLRVLRGDWRSFACRARRLRRPPASAFSRVVGRQPQKLWREKCDGGRGTTKKNTKRTPYGDT